MADLFFPQTHPSVRLYLRSDLKMNTVHNYVSICINLSCRASFFFKLLFDLLSRSCHVTVDGCNSAFGALPFSAGIGLALAALPKAIRLHCEIGGYLKVVHQTIIFGIISQSQHHFRFKGKWPPYLVFGAKLFLENHCVKYGALIGGRERMTKDLALSRKTPLFLEASNRVWFDTRLQNPTKYYTSTVYTINS